MSPLTKLFVALHVLLSAMLVAGVIVFVNLQEKWKVSSETANAQATIAKSALADANTKYDADIATYKGMVTAMTGAVDTTKAKLAAAEQANNTQAATLADMSSKMSLQIAENAKLAEGIKASQDAQTRLTDAVTELRKSADTRVTEVAQLNSRISDLTNNLDVTTREWKFAVEQLTQARADADKMSNQLKGVGITPDEAAVAGAKVGPPINGVIRAVEPIGGSLYATISVGSADSVAKGMQFNVVERGTGKFLGLLTVTAVEANEASGRISGPATEQIKSGAEVKTQLR